MAYRKIEDSKLTAVANAIRAKLGATDTMTPDEMPSFIEAINIGVVPNYWKTYLDTKSAEINSALDAAGETKAAFLWYTDAHWTTNYGTSPVLLKYLSEYTGMKKTFFGGDIATEKTGEIATLKAWQEMVKDIPNHHSLMGNHDNQVSELTTPKARADFFFDPERTGDVVFGTHATNGKNYYYIDNHIENTRYICLSTGRMWTNADEVEWCIEVLLSTPKNWHIVVISHLWLNNDYNNGGTILTTPVDYTQGYLNMFDAYNYRQSGTESFTGTAYDFVNAQAKIEFIIGGHVHQDYDFATAYGIPVILTECDAWQERDDASVATKGTTSESCVYAIIADYAAKTVKVINVGRGDSRNLAIPDVATYTNWAKKAIDTTGTIYNNGKGYKEDVRVNSSYQDASAAGWDATGYIPVRIGDVVRFKNCSVYDLANANGTNRMHFKFFDASFGFVVESSSYNTSSKPSAQWSAVHGSNGDLTQVTIPTAYKDTIRYMRITMDDINEDSIITVNEEIE